MIRSARQIMLRDLIKSAWVWRSQLIQVPATVGNSSRVGLQLEEHKSACFNASAAGLHFVAGLFSALKVFLQFSTLFRNNDYDL